jgi:hypothetical protein
LRRNRATRGTPGAAGATSPHEYAEPTGRNSAAQ